MKDSPADETTFEQALAGLEKVVRDLEEGKIGLEESLALYENGIALVRRCQGQLRQAEQRILELRGQDEGGNMVTRAFEHNASLTKN